MVKTSGRPVKAARRVDQFKDLDGYAGQVSGVRRVLTISNTTAHMAGALGVPCVVILDNGSITNWPDDGETAPFYPSTRLIRRGTDDWEITLRRGWAMLRTMLREPGARVMPGSLDKDAGACEQHKGQEPASHDRATTTALGALALPVLA